MYIHREIESFVQKLAGFYPVVTITGPRQSGKTTPSNITRTIFAPTSSATCAGC